MKVTVEMGATIPFPDNQYGNVKPLIRIEEIDPTEDVERQIELGIEIAGKVFVKIDEQLDVVISEALAPETGKPGYRTRVEKIEKSLDAMKISITNMSDYIKGNVKPIALAVANGKKENK